MYTVYLTDYNSTPEGNQITPTRDELYIFNPIIYDDGVITIEPTLRLEASKAGSFSCTLTPTNNGYGKIIRGLTRVVVKKKEKIIFIGRINNDEKDLYLNQKITAEGSLAYLNDSLSDKNTFVNKTLSEILTYIFNKHNSKFPTEPWKQFVIKECHANFVGYNNPEYTATGAEDTLAQYDINYDKTLDLVTELIDLAKGVLKLKYNEDHGYWDVYIYDKYDLKETSNQRIEFGQNLLDLIQSYDRNEIATVVAPFGGEMIQPSKEIGVAVAGDNITGPGAEWKPDYIYVRDKENSSVNDSSSAYEFYRASDGGYWSVKLNIATYNAQNPDNPIKKLYVSWRGYYFETHEGEEAGAGKCEDCAWRVYDSTGDVLGYHKFTDDGEFNSDIDEEIDLTDPQYFDATIIVLCGWGGLITPEIRRDALVVEQEDLLNISECSTFSEDGLSHTQGEPYLKDDNLVSLYGVIEKKLEYDIPDENKPVTEWSYPYDGPLGRATFYYDSSLGYDIGNNDPPDYETHKGDYQILPIWSSGSGSSCIEYELPDLRSPNRPRGVFISSREKNVGEHEYNNTHWLVNGQWAVFDTAHQVLAYQTADIDNSAWRNIKDFFLDLSDPKYYGAKYIRVGGFGGVIGVDVRPSDDSYSRNQLLDRAKLYLKTYQWEQAVIEATAVDLSLTSDQWDSFEICTNVPVISEFHGMEATMPLYSLDIQLDNYENNSITLGYDNDEYLSSQLS